MSRAETRWCDEWQPAPGFIDNMPPQFVVLEYDTLAGITAVHQVEGQDAARDMVQGSEDGPQFTLKPGTGLVAMQVPAWAHRFQPDRGSAGEWGKTAPFIVGGGTAEPRPYLRSAEKAGPFQGTGWRIHRGGAVSPEGACIVAESPDAVYAFWQSDGPAYVVLSAILGPAESMTF